MKNLGFATRVYKDCSMNDILLIFRAIVQLHFSSFKCIFIYICGHGHNGSFKVTDGEVRVDEVRTILADSKITDWEDIVKVIFCDFCRTQSKKVEEMQSSKNLMVVYSTPLNKQSYLLTGCGLGIGTQELVKLLLRQKTCNLLDLLSSELSKNMELEGKKYYLVEPMRSEVKLSMVKKFDLYGDKLKSCELI